MVVGGVRPVSNYDLEFVISSWNWDWVWNPSWNIASSSVTRLDQRLGTIGSCCCVVPGPSRVTHGFSVHRGSGGPGQRWEWGLAWAAGSGSGSGELPSLASAPPVAV
jgi:hypothetical protein